MEDDVGRLIEKRDFPRLLYCLMKSPDEIKTAASTFAMDISLLYIF